MGFSRKTMALSVIFVAFEVVLLSGCNSQAGSKIKQSLKIKLEMRWFTYFSEVLSFINADECLRRHVEE